jgi:hypothetical protein
MHMHVQISSYDYAYGENMSSHTYIAYIRTYSQAIAEKGMVNVAVAGGSILKTLGATVCSL